MTQEFKPIAIGGSNLARATKLAETIASDDYHVADMFVEGKEGSKPKVRYKDQKPASSWGQVNGHAINNEMLNTAIALGRQTRLQFGGDGIDTIKKMPDLIAASKRKSMRLW